MYITSDLFGPAPSSDHQDNNPHPQQQHSRTTMTDRHPPTLGKRKRRAGDDEAPDSAHGSHCNNQHARISTLTLAPSGSVQQPWLSPGKTAYKHQPGTHTIPPSRRSPCSSTTRPVKHLKRTMPKPRLQSPPSLSKSSSHLMDLDETSDPGPSTRSPQRTTTESTTISADALRSCHICYRVPKRKQEVHSFVDCKDCGERACYVCTRQCTGGCEKPLCSTCCIEVGEDGDPWCSGCYDRVLKR